LNAAWVLLGVGSGSTLTIPASYADYASHRILVNNAVGGNDVIIANAGGGSVTIPNGYVAEIAVSDTAISFVSDIDGRWAREQADYPLLISTDTSATKEREIVYNNGAFIGSSSSAVNEGAIANWHFSNMDATLNLTDDTSTQNVLQAAADTLTLSAGSYRFQGQIFMTAGTNSHYLNFGIGGTATVADCNYKYISRNCVAGNNAGGAIVGWLQSETLTKISSAGTAGGWVLEVSGTLRISSAGTVIPQISFSAATGATPAVQIGTQFEFRCLGSATVASVGDWA